MAQKINIGMSFFEKYASDSRVFEHLYLRGNFKHDMFYDKVDCINAWNRIMLSAMATGVIILSVVILNNHFHITVIVKDLDQLAQFKHHLRLSITQYHNFRYKVRGTLGTRTLKNAALKDEDDVADCVCYHARNVLHHGLRKDFMDYPFSTVRWVFGLENDSQKGVYNRDSLPGNLERAYLPARVQLPKGWWVTRDGMIVPPETVFKRGLIESLFHGSKEIYLERLSQQTAREEANQDEPVFEKYASDSRNFRSPDERVAEFVSSNCHLPIPSMTDAQKMEAITLVLKEFPSAKLSWLSRLFGIPYTTLYYRLRSSKLRE